MIHAQSGASGARIQNFSNNARDEKVRESHATCATIRPEIATIQRVGQFLSEAEQ